MARNFLKIYKGISVAPQGSTPSSPADGDIYYDSGLGQFQFRQNGAWLAPNTGASVTTPGSTTTNAIATWGNTSGTSLLNTKVTIDTNAQMAIQSGLTALTLGADTGATTLTNSTAKSALIGAYHYTNAQAPMAMMFANSLASTNVLNIGGGTSSFNAATTINLYLGATATTLTGSIAAALSSSGLSVTNAISASNFSGSHSGTSSGTNTGDQTITLTSDVTGSGTGSFATTVAKIQGTTVSGTTGSTNVVFSTAPTIAGGSISALTTFSLRDTSAAFNVVLAATSSTTLTAQRTLTIDTANTSTTLKMGANLTVSGATTINGTFSGTSSGTNTGDQTITLTSDVTGSGTGSFATTVAKIQGTAVSGTTGSTNVVFSTSPTISTPSISGGTHTAITSLGIRDTSAAFDVTLAATSSTTLTAGRTLTIDTTNTSTTLKMGANLTVSGATTVNGTFSGTSSGTNTGDQTITLTSDVTGTGTGSFATTVAKIQGTTVSGTTGSGNVVFSAAPALTGSATAASIALSAVLSTLKGTDLSTTGSQNDVSTSGTSLLRYTGAGTATITSFANPSDGKHLIFMNASSSVVTLSNASGSGTATNRILTGTGADLSLAVDASVLLSYDNTAQRWRIIGGSGSSSLATNTTTTGITIATTTDVQFSNQSAAITLTLPAVSAGKSVVIKDISGTASTNLITIARGGSALIDGQTQLIINLNYGSVRLISDGTNWFAC